MTRHILLFILILSWPSCYPNVLEKGASALLLLSEQPILLPSTNSNTEIMAHTSLTLAAHALAECVAYAKENKKNLTTLLIHQLASLCATLTPLNVLHAHKKQVDSYATSLRTMTEKYTLLLQKEPNQSCHTALATVLYHLTPLLQSATWHFSESSRSLSFLGTRTPPHIAGITVTLLTIGSFTFALLHRGSVEEISEKKKEDAIAKIEKIKYCYQTQRALREKLAEKKSIKLLQMMQTYLASLTPETFTIPPHHIQDNTHPYSPESLYRTYQKYELETEYLRIKEQIKKNIRIQQYYEYWCQINEVLVELHNEEDEKSRLLSYDHCISFLIGANQTILPFIEDTPEYRSFLEDTEKETPTQALHEKMSLFYLVIKLHADSRDINTLLKKTISSDKRTTNKDIIRLQARYVSQSPTNTPLSIYEKMYLYYGHIDPHFTEKTQFKGTSCPTPLALSRSTSPQPLRKIPPLARSIITQIAEETGGSPQEPDSPAGTGTTPF